MRAVIINPTATEDRRVVEVEYEWSDFWATGVLGTPPVLHSWLSRLVPGHEIYVDEEAVSRQRKPWKFKGALVWGPAIITGYNRTSAHVPLGRVRDLCSFDA